MSAPRPINFPTVVRLAESRGLDPQPRWRPVCFRNRACPWQVCSPEWRKAEFTLPSGLRRPSRFQRAPAPRLVYLPNWRRIEVLPPYGCPFIWLQTSGSALVYLILQDGPRARNLTRTPAFEAQCDIHFTTRGKWRATSELHGDYSSLGSRSTVCCRVARGPSGENLTHMVPLRRRVPDNSSHARGNGAHSGTRTQTNPPSRGG